MLKQFYCYLHLIDVDISVAIVLIYDIIPYEPV